MVDKTFIIIFFFVFHFASTNCAVEPEIQQLGGSCYPRDTCAARNENDDNLWGKYTCECERHCLKHGTCCYDSEHVMDFEARSFSNAGNCQKVETMSLSIWIVSKGSKEWHRSPSDTNKCENARTGLRDPISVLPVTSMSSNVTYKNYFCALCNFDSDKLVLWNIEIKKTSTVSRVDLLENLEYDSNQNAWGFQDKGRAKTRRRFEKVNLRFRVPSALLTVAKPCYPGMISECKPLQANPDLQKKCDMYFAPIRVRGYDTQFHYYRNIHCALCNTLQAPFDTTCPRLISERRRFRTTFDMLLDVNEQHGSKFGRIQRCANGQLYDPFYKKCRVVKCALPGYILRNDSCVKA